MVGRPRSTATLSSSIAARLPPPPSSARRTAWRCSNRFTAASAIGRRSRGPDRRASRDGARSPFCTPICSPSCIRLATAIWTLTGPGPTRGAGCGGAAGPAGTSGWPRFTGAAAVTAARSVRIAGPRLRYESDRRHVSAPLERCARDLLAEWHPTRNDLDPYAVGPGSERRAWWRCGDCGHEWDAVICERARRERPGHHGGCPACGHRRGGDVRAHAPRERSLAALHPQLLEEWHPTLNGDLDPYAIKPGSDRRVWWHCKYCGGDWQAPPVSRRQTPRGGCPTCAMRLARA